MAASGNEAMTIKQLKNYADNKQLKTGAMQEFCEYMGIPYVPPLEIISDIDGFDVSVTGAKKNGTTVTIDEMHIVNETGQTLMTSSGTVAHLSDMTWYPKSDINIQFGDGILTYIQAPEINDGYTNLLIKTNGEIVVNATDTDFTSGISYAKSNITWETN